MRIFRSTNKSIFAIALNSVRQLAESNPSKWKKWKAFYKHLNHTHRTTMQRNEEEIFFPQAIIFVGRLSYFARRLSIAITWLLLTHKYCPFYYIHRPFCLLIIHHRMNASNAFKCLTMLFKLTSDDPSHLLFRYDIQHRKWPFPMPFLVEICSQAQQQMSHWNVAFKHSNEKCTPINNL